MPQPGQFAPQGDDWLVREVQNLRREVNELRAANPFGAMGIKPMPDGLIVEGYETVNGPLEVNGEMAVNGEMDVSGAADFTGNVRIGGTLELPAGIIGNEALASPLTTGAAGFTAQNQTFTTTATVFGTQEITVPEGFTKAVAINGVSAGGTNSTATGDYIYVSSSINNVAGGEMPTYAAAGFYGSASAFGIRTLTGLASGSVISVGVRVRTSGGTWNAMSANVVNVNAMVIFYR